MKAAREREEGALFALLKMAHFTLSFRLSAQRFERKKREGRAFEGKAVCWRAKNSEQNQLQQESQTPLKAKYSLTYSVSPLKPLPLFLSFFHSFVLLDFLVHSALFLKCFSPLIVNFLCILWGS